MLLGYLITNCFVLKSINVNVILKIENMILLSFIFRHINFILAKY